MADTTDSVVLPCGCRIDCDVIDGTNTLIVTACPAGESCTYVRYVLTQAQTQSKPSSVIGAAQIDGLVTGEK